MTIVAVGVNIYQITQSTFAVSLVGAFALVPMIFAGLYGGFSNSCNSLTVWNNQIVAVGSFSSADGVAVNNIARWDGSAWHDVGGGFTINPVTSVLALGSQLIVAGGYGLGNAGASGPPGGVVGPRGGRQRRGGRAG